MTNEKFERNGRQEWIDVARGIGILVMLVNHTNVPGFARYIMSGFNMPFFFILSGYLYRKSNENFKDFVVRKFKVYLVPYFGFCIINLFLNIPIEMCNGIRGGELRKSIMKHLFWILYSKGHNWALPNCGPLWFLPCIFVAGIFMFHLLKINNKGKQIVICVVFIAIQMIFNKITGGGVFQLPWHIDTAMYGMVFMWLGYLIKEYKILEKLTCTTCIILLAVGSYASLSNLAVIDMNNKVIGNPIILYVGATSFSIALFWFCKNHIEDWFYVSFIGKNTDICMAFNFAIMSYSTIIWERIPIFRNIDFSFWWLSSAVVIMGCYIIAYCRYVGKEMKGMYNERIY